MITDAYTLESTGRTENLKGIAREADIGRDLARTGREVSQEDDTARYLWHCQNALYLIAEVLAITALPGFEATIDEPEDRAGDDFSDGT